MAKGKGYTKELTLGNRKWVRADAAVLMNTRSFSPCLSQTQEKMCWALVAPGSGAKTAVEQWMANSLKLGWSVQEGYSVAVRKSARETPLVG